MTDKKAIKSSLLDQSIAKSSEPVKEKAPIKFNIKNGYAPADTESLNIRFESTKKKVTIFSFIGIIVNFLAFLYLGPFPWNKNIKLETQEMTIVFTCWDNLAIVTTFLILILGFSKRIITTRSEIGAFKLKIFVLTLVQFANATFVSLFVGFDLATTEGLLVRVCPILATSYVWYQLKALDSCFEDTRPILP